MTDTEKRKAAAAIFTAAANGEKIQWASDTMGWIEVDPFSARARSNVIDAPRFYRIAPKLVTRGWNCPEDVPGPVCWIRECEEDEMPILITGFVCSGSDTYRGCAGVATGSERPSQILWPQLSKWQHSTDRKTWKKCEVTEEA